MAIDGLTSLTTLFQFGAPSSSSSRSSSFSSGSYASNVAPVPSPEIGISNRAAGTYAGMVNPKKETEGLEDEFESHNFYSEFEEEEEEEEEDRDEWEELEMAGFEEDDWIEDLEDEEEFCQLLAYRREKGMFYDELF